MLMDPHLSREYAGLHSRIFQTQPGPRRINQLAPICRQNGVSFNLFNEIHESMYLRFIKFVDLLRGSVNF